MLTNLDINSPVIQQLIKNNPALAQQLGLAPALAPAGALTMEQVQAAITERLKGLAPAAAPADRLVLWVNQIDAMLKRALPAEDFADLTAYVHAGAPGFDTLLKGDALFPLAQLLWEIVRGSQK